MRWSRASWAGNTASTPSRRGWRTSALAPLLALSLACEAPPQAPSQCLHGALTLADGEDHDDPWACERCACRGGVVTCAPLPGCGGDAALAPEDAALEPDVGPAGCEIHTQVRHDADGDALQDAEELAWGLDPCVVDSDGDGQSDGAEVRFGSDPLDLTSRLPRYVEIDPRVGEGLIETEWFIQIRRADVTFILDTTGSMAALLDGTAAAFGEVAAAAAEALPEPTFGLAAMRDYAHRGMGAPGDRAFELIVPQTRDLEALQAGLDGLREGGGGDGMEAHLEAFHQALAGWGHDMDCDGLLDPGADIPPFIPNPSDAFGGAAEGVGLGAAGKGGGVGLAPGALPVIIYGSDARMRDPLLGDAAPGGCPIDASMDLVVAEANDLGARFIGVMVDPFRGEAQAIELAERTGSLDADGSPLVFRWTGDTEGLRDLIVGALAQLTRALRFERVEVVSPPDDPGAAYLHAVTPPFIGPVTAEEFGEARRFEVRLRGPVNEGASDLLLEIELQLQAEGGVDLGRQRWVLRVPRRGGEVLR